MIMTLYFDVSNNLIRMGREDEPFAPPVASSTLEFDSETNAALITDIIHHPEDYTISDSTLLKNSNPVAIAADGTTKTYLDNLLNSATTAITNNLSYLDIVSPNNAQAIAQVRALTQQVNGIIRRLVLFGRKTT